MEPPLLLQDKYYNIVTTIVQWYTNKYHKFVAVHRYKCVAQVAMSIMALPGNKINMFSIASVGVL